MKKIIYIYFILASLFTSNILIAETIHFLDYRYILNESIAGKKAQSELKNKLDKNIKSIQSKEKSIRDEEKKIIQQKKIISPEEYKKKINDLRKKVSLLQSERNKILSSVANERAKAKNKILENLNPILSDYMSKNNIKIILDKKNLVRADNSLDITKQIVELLNKKIKSIKIN
jgi:outer membrane protein